MEGHSSAHHGAVGSATGSAGSCVMFPPVIRAYPEFSGWPHAAPSVLFRMAAPLLPATMSVTSRIHGGHAANRPGCGDEARGAGQGNGHGTRTRRTRGSIGHGHTTP